MIKVIVFIATVSVFSILFALPPLPAKNDKFIDAHLITNLIQAECYNCGEGDIDYITYTVMSRKLSNKFPNTVQEVLLQRNQFAGLDRKVEAGVMINSYVYKRVLHNLGKKEFPKVLFFIASNCRSINCEKIRKKRTVVYSTNNHIYLK